VYQLQDKWDQAIEHLRKATAIDSQLSSAQQYLAESMLAAGRIDEAIEAYQRYLQLAPGDAQSRYQLARALLATGHAPQAVAQLDLVLQAQPDAVPALNLTARILAAHSDAQIRRPQQAVQLAQRAATLTGRREPVILDVLATAYAAAGQFELAVAAAHEALALAEKAGNDDLVERIKARLELFVNGQTYREPLPDAINR
jgi:tetratricopeptide (TPR) repeat protein